MGKKKDKVRPRSSTGDAAGATAPAPAPPPAAATSSAQDGVGKEKNQAVPERSPEKLLTEENYNKIRGLLEKRLEKLIHKIFQTDKVKEKQKETRDALESCRLLWEKHPSVQQSRVSELEQKLSQKETENLQQEREVNTWKNEVRDLKQKLAQKETENKKLQGLGKEDADQQDKIRQLECDLKSCNDKVFSLENDKKNLEGEKERLEFELQSATEKFQGVTQRQEADKVQEREVNTWKNEVRDLKQKLAQKETEKKKLQGLGKENDDQQDKIRQLERDLKRSDNKVYSLENDVKSLKGKNERLKSDLQSAREKTQDVAQLQQAAKVQERGRYQESKAQGIKVILPRESHDDSRVKPVWSELMTKLRRRQIDVDVEVKYGPSIEQTDGVVILPCICASRVGSDLVAALQKANIKKDIKLVIIIFNHLASHCNTIRVKTRERLSDRSILERCHLMVDAVYWEGKMSECKANDELMTELGRFLKQQ